MKIAFIYLLIPSSSKVPARVTECLMLHVCSKWSNDYYKRVCSSGVLKPSPVHVISKYSTVIQYSKSFMFIHEIGLPYSVLIFQQLWWSCFGTTHKLTFFIEWKQNGVYVDLKERNRYAISRSLLNCQKGRMPSHAFITYSTTVVNVEEAGLSSIDCTEEAHFILFVRWKYLSAFCVNSQIL